MPLIHGKLYPLLFIAMYVYRKVEVDPSAAHGLTGEPSGDTPGFARDVAARCWADRCDTAQGIPSPYGMNIWRH